MGAQRPFARLSLRETACSDISVLCVPDSESYCVWRSRGYFNCLVLGLATGKLFKPRFKLFYRCLFRKLWTIAVFALRHRGADCFHLAVKPCTLPLDLPSGQRTGSLLVSFHSAGFYTAISNPEISLLIISVVSMLYQACQVYST